MSKEERKQSTIEWRALRESHPRWARTLLAQQVILLELSQQGNRTVDAYLCRLIKFGFVVRFAGYWAKRCGRPLQYMPVGPILECLSRGGDPAACLGSTDENDFFEDPTERYPFPPKLPDGPGGPGQPDFPILSGDQGQ